MNPSPQESQIEEFVAKYSPDVAAQLREARARLRAFFSHGFELVFDNYNALVFGISPTARSQDAFISVAGYPRWVTLFFLHGAQLHDPKALLEGDGKQVRSIRLKTPQDINQADVEAIIVQAIRPHQSALHAAPRLTTTIKMVVAKQRSRRPAAKAAAVHVSPSLTQRRARK
jgi:hypothetical protein